MRRAVLAVIVLVASGAVVGAAIGSRSAQSGGKVCLVAATGALGDNANGVAGGIVQKNGAKASLSLVCNFLASGVMIKIPSHSLSMTTFVHALPGACAQAGDTVSCKLSTSLQRTGIKLGGGWKDSFAWRFTPDDSASHNAVDGSCHLPMVITLTNAGGATSYTKKTETVCEFALGDALR